MKAIKLLPIVLMSTLITTAQGFADASGVNVNKKLKDKIVRLIERPDLSSLEGEKFQTEVEFIVTRQHRIVVLEVYTDIDFLEKYIKEKLNYQQIDLKGVPYLTPYRIEVNFFKPGEDLPIAFFRT